MTFRRDFFYRNNMPFDPDTEMGGPSGKFPLTRHSAMLQLRSDDAPTRTRAGEAIISSYWKPAYKYLRIQWHRSNEDAKDLTQGFFTQALEKGWLAAYEPSKGSFRSFLRTCLDGFVSHQDEAASRLKRGGGITTIPLDFETAEGELRELPVAGDLRRKSISGGSGYGIFLQHRSSSYRKNARSSRNRNISNCFRATTSTRWVKVISRWPKS